MKRQHLAADEFALLAVDAATGQTLLAHRPDQPLRPASTMKLLTTACALERLGPSRRLETVFLGDRRPDAGGRLEGSLYVVGGGDPLLRGEDLWVALRELRALGLREITGDVVLDDHLFGPPARPASWPPRASSNPYDADQQALSLAWNSIEVIVRPGSAMGAPALVTTFPLGAGIPLVGHPTTGTETALDIGFQPGEEGAPGRIRVEGSVAQGSRPHRRWIRLGTPRQIFGGALQELLTEVGIRVAGRTRPGRAPKQARVLLRHASRPLAEIVAATNKYSSNFAAEILLRLLAARPEGPPATTAAGLRVLAACLDGWKIDRQPLALHDGSGLAPADRLTARSLVAVLERAVRSPAWGPELLASLPRAGEDGTLRRRLRGYRNRLRAKTGSVRGVGSLAGQLVLADGRRILLAILVERQGGRPVAPAVVDALLAALEQAALTAGKPSPR